MFTEDFWLQIEDQRERVAQSVLESVLVGMDYRYIESMVDFSSVVDVFKVMDYDIWKVDNKICF